jgi:hypothetical protein
VTTATDTATHVLVWIPPYLLKGWDEGYWELQARAGFESGTHDMDWESVDLPRDTGLDALAQWVQEQLGYEVTLVRVQEEIGVAPRGWPTRLAWPPSRLCKFRAEPVCYVIRAS